MAVDGLTTRLGGDERRAVVFWRLRGRRLPKRRPSYDTCHRPRHLGDNDGYFI